jgi:hypothetical protein
VTKFEIHWTDDGQGGDLVTHYGDNASYTFNDGGLLIVKNGEGTQVTYSPTAWRKIVEEDRPAGSWAYSV